MSMLYKTWPVIFATLIYCSVSSYAIAGYDEHVNENVGKIKRDCINNGRFWTDTRGGGSCSNKAPVSPQLKARCQSYAKRAILQSRRAADIAGCRVRVDARWTGNYRQHYDWCLTAQDAWVYSEEKARANHLIRCTQPIRTKPRAKLIRTKPIRSGDTIIDNGAVQNPIHR